MPSKGTPLQLRIALGLITLLFAFGSRLFASDILEARRSLSWPNTTGTIVRSEAALAYKSVTMYDALIRYSYQVNGTSYESTRVTASNYYRGDKSWARDLVAKTYPLGSRIPVYYDPADPARAVLIPGRLEPGARVWPWVMLGMSALCLVGLIATFFDRSLRLL